MEYSTGNNEGPECLKEDKIMGGKKTTEIEVERKEIKTFSTPQSGLAWAGNSSSHPLGNSLLF